MAVKMTTAEYEAKYGKPPAAKAAPVKMTQAQYDAKYNAKPSMVQKFDAGMKAATAERTAELGRISDAQARGEQGGLRSLFQAGGQVVGAAMDPFVQGAKAVVPDWLKTALAVGAKAASPIITKPAEALANTKLFQEAAAASPELPIERDIKAGLEYANLSPVPKGAGALTKVVPAAGSVAKKVLPTAERGAEKALEDALDVTTRPFNKKATVSALESSGKPGGFGESKSVLGKLTGRTEYVPSDYDKRIAGSVADVVRTNNSPVRNIQGINSKISKVSDEQVTPLLKANPGIFNTKTYNAHLKRIEPPDYVKTDAVLERTYDLVRERFIDVASKHPKTKLGLWEARKELDGILEEQFGRGVFDPEKYSVFQRAVADMRRATNDFINEGTDDAFKANMRQLSDMYEARGRVALDGYRLANSNRFSRWIAENPKKWKALELIVGGGTAAGLVGSALSD